LQAFFVNNNNNNLIYYGKDITLNLTTTCHAGQQQPGLARGEQPNAYVAKLLTIRSVNPGHYLVSIHQMAPLERGAHIW